MITNLIKKFVGLTKFSKFAKIKIFAIFKYGVLNMSNKPGSPKQQDKFHRE